MLQLPSTDLRPVLRSLTLSLLPAVEDEASEDFDRAFQLLETLELKFEGHQKVGSANDKGGFFWQCLFLAVITSPSRRQGALNFLTRRMPKFTKRTGALASQPSRPGEATDNSLSKEAEAVVSPEPGLLIRAFVCGLFDPQVLVQRGFLDLLLNNLPLDSPLLQSRTSDDDLDRLIAAALHVLLRRDMSLNRRLWSWFLGPDPPADALEGDLTSPTNPSTSQVQLEESAQLRYFSSNGSESLKHCVLGFFDHDVQSPSERARPFRICLSLMDKWEIGSSIASDIFLPAMQNAYNYTTAASATDASDLMRSASLFFDGIEASLIWSDLIGLISTGFLQEGESIKSLSLLKWIVQQFNIKDEEMTTTHVPAAVVYLLAILDDAEAEQLPNQNTSLGFEIVSILLDLIPPRVFGDAREEEYPSARPTSRIRQSVERSYRERNQPSNIEPLPSKSGLVWMIYHLLKSITLQSLASGQTDVFESAVSLLTMLLGRTRALEALHDAELSNGICHCLKESTRRSQSLNFSSVWSIVTLFGALTAASPNSVPRHVILEPSLITQIWQYLSPTRPKYHVEAVRALWQMQALIGPHDHLTSTLSSLLRQCESLLDFRLDPAEEAMKRFFTLWTHTVQVHNSHMRNGKSTGARRGSATPGSQDASQNSHRRQTLEEPLMLVLDALEGPENSSKTVVGGWIRYLPTLDQVIEIHLIQVINVLDSLRATNAANQATLTRRSSQAARDLQYVFTHLLNVFRNGGDWAWECLQDIRVESGVASDGATMLAEYCIRFVCGEVGLPDSLSWQASEILELYLSSPLAHVLRPLDLDSRIMDYLILGLSKGAVHGHEALLTLSLNAMKLRLEPRPEESSIARPGSSISSKRPSSASHRPNLGALLSSTGPSPPSQLLNFLQVGFSAAAARPHLNKWVEFLSLIFPDFSAAIFTTVMPLVDCLCREIEKTHNELVSLSKESAQTVSATPELTALALMEALEMVLARAHECLTEDQQHSDPEPRPVPSRGLLGNVTSGVFKTEGPSLKTAQSNSRLTVILAFQDAIRSFVKLWVWASRCGEVEDFDRSSAATTAYAALKIRKRTRNLLEQIFQVEPLEGLEVIISTWCFNEDPTATPSPSFDLLHAMQGTRPKNVLPAILDALCSRVNPASLSPARCSSQTVSLSALDVAVFLSAYLQSTEDDAMDEIWLDCMAFLRDVLSNPLPYRQILPALLSIILLLARKIENTNFGEQKKMRRELGDLFMRLMTATLTTMPSGYIHDGNQHHSASIESRTNAAAGQRSMTLIPALEYVTSHVGTLLESEKVTAAVNNISTSLLGPMVRSKSFPDSMSSDALALFLQCAKKAPSAKSWRKELLEAFSDARFLASSPDRMERHWFPLISQWCLYDKERMPELLTKFTPPSSAGIMFGVGANAARLEADRKTQMNLRRVALMFLASSEDTFAAPLRILTEKLVELFEATSTSSPSSAIKADLFMLLRAVMLSNSALQLGSLWAIVNDNLRAALLSLMPDSTNSGSFGNLALLQACKLLDLLVAHSSDEFELHEWLYITDTIDAVYRPPDFEPRAISDQVAEALASDINENSAAAIAPTPTASAAPGRRTLLLNDEVISNVKDDFKAMARDDFARAVLRPFLSQLSIHAYEGVYSMDAVDLGFCRQSLLRDLLDLTSIAS